ncbi:uncharacterized protein [Periplaneta americana]|uniref:uncharacterized protein isoform X6 n=1 Tax=Periplaneta americana TaxID=6978 RepID=UPI0037E8045A
MDVIKKESEVDPLAIQSNDNTETDEKPLSEEGNLLDLHVVRIKTECVNHSYDLNPEVGLEETAVTTNFVTAKCKAEEDSFDLDRLQQQQTREVSSEEDAVSTERNHVRFTTDTDPTITEKGTELTNEMHTVIRMFAMENVEIHHNLDVEVNEPEKEEEDNVRYEQERRILESVSSSDNETDSESCTSQQSDSQYAPTREKKPREISFEEKVKVINYWLLPGPPKHHRQKFSHRTWSSMKHHFTWLSNERQLYRMKEQVQRHQNS